MTDREAFEAWRKSDRHPGTTWVALAEWNAWQASRRQALEEAVAICLAPDGRDVGMTGANCAAHIKKLRDQA